MLYVTITFPRIIIYFPQQVYFIFYFFFCFSCAAGQRGERDIVYYSLGEGFDWPPHGSRPDERTIVLYGYSLHLNGRFQHN